MKKMILNNEIWANAMREKIPESLHWQVFVIHTSTGNQISTNQFREAAHIPE